MYRVNELSFLGHTITAEGISPSKIKIDSIISFRRPKNETELRSFLGLANYMNKFIQDLATISEPLRQLMQKGNKFEWTDEHTRSFEKIKQAMADVKNLGYFDVNDCTVLVADASPVGLGAILAQTDTHGKPRIVNYASKSLTDTESRYCQT